MIRDTEERTNLRPDKKGKLIPHPTAGRSEAGAIDRLELYSAADRRKFSVDEAMAWLSNPMTGSNYHLELFEIPPPRSHWDAVDADRQLLYASFIEGLATIGHGLDVGRVVTVGRDQPQLALRLTKADDPPLVLLQRSAHDRKRDGG